MVQLHQAIEPILRINGCIINFNGFRSFLEQLTYALGSTERFLELAEKFSKSRHGTAYKSSINYKGREVAHSKDAGLHECGTVPDHQHNSSENRKHEKRNK